jgi:NADPH:quinone reductase-like Zn-dependent oxidoreductase
VLGLDVAGTVVAVGAAVTRFTVGDEVFGFGTGTFAQYAVAREDKLARKPGNLSPTQAAVVPVSAATDGNRRYDVILDIAGNPTLSRLRRALTPTGTAVIVGGEDGGSFSGGMNRQLRGVALSLFARQRLTTFIAKQRVGDLERLTVLIETGRLTPSLDRTYPLEQVPEAMRHLEDGNARGKVAITI